MDKCSRLLYQLNEAETKINKVSLISKTSSPFNDTHLKFSNIGACIETSLKSIEKEVKVIETRDVVNSSANVFEKKTIQNTTDLIKMRLKDLSFKFKKFLQAQGETIRSIEQRRSNLVSSSSKGKPNDYSYLPGTDPDSDTIENTLIEEDTILAQVNNYESTQYYKDRTTAVQQIEKAMNELSTMFGRLSSMIYEQGQVISRIDNNTDISLNNIEMGLNEVIKIKNDVSSNRKLLIKIFLILIFSIVVYIVFFTN